MSVRDRTARFDLAAPPLLRATLVHGGAAGDRLVLTAHHIVVDGWSMPLLVAELQALYDADGDATAAGLAPVVGFDRYLDWLAGRDPAESRQVWSEALADLTEPTLLAPPDPNRAAGAARPGPPAATGRRSPSASPTRRAGGA